MDEILDLYLPQDLTDIITGYMKDNTQYNKVINQINRYNSYYKTDGDLLNPLYSGFPEVCLILIKLSTMK